jgi:hypothetical protein
MFLTRLRDPGAKLEQIIRRAKGLSI